jgi:YYY domain-containing protein
MAGNRASEHLLAPPQRPAPWLTWLILAAIVALGAAFCTLNLYGWDSDTRQHPDERFMTSVADRLAMPASLAEYLDSSRNPLNPRNSGNTFYVYGLLPQTLTHLTAVVLTPQKALRSTVRAATPSGWERAPQIPNPDLRGPRSAFLQALLNPAGNDLTSVFFVHYVGRSWSALFQLLSIVVVFLIGRRLYGRRVGLLAALFLALAALPIQLAHFFTVDSATAFFTLLAIYWAVRAAHNGGVGSFTALGISIGAAMACRVTMAALGLAAVLAVVLRVWGAQAAANEQRPDGDLPFCPSALLPFSAFRLLALAGVLSVLAFRLFQPDAFIGTSFFDLRPDPRFLGNIADVGQQVSGVLDFPPAQQWAGRTPFLFPLQNMIIWGLGLPLGLAAWLAWAVAGWQLLRAAWDSWNGGDWRLFQHRLAHLIPWSWIAFYFAWQGGQFGMTMRYYLLLYGLLALFAAWGLVKLWDRRPTIDNRRLTFWRDWRRWPLVVGRWSVVVVILGTLGWAYAFTRIYTRPHSRVAASRWIYAHIPLGATLTYEEWDDPLPVSIDDHTLYEYGFLLTRPYDEDRLVKYTGYMDRNGQFQPGLFDQLDQAGYIILSSNRVYDSATRLPMRYPALTRYYHYLFSGKLGFEQVADITSYPSLFGISIPDQGAEEAWSVYDHPRVLIFKKTSAYSRARAAQLITSDIAWDEVYPLPTALVSRVPTALRLTDSQWPAYRVAGSWAGLFAPARLVSQMPWLAWLLALEVLGLAAFPLLFRMLPGLPDRGFALAKTLALLLVAYAAWLLGSFHLLAFTPASVWLCAGALIAAGALVGWRARCELLAFVRQRFVALIMAEQIFVLAWISFLLIRALNPDLWHPARSGEKPINLAFLTAVLKSAAFPPYDPWFAGGFINHHYFGLVFIGALVHLTGIVPTIAYNLAVPTLFALTALGAWGVGYNLVAPSIDKMTRRQGDKVNDLDEEITLSPPHPVTLSARWIVRERRAIVTGIVAPVFVVLAGNLMNALFFLGGYAAQNVRRPEWVYWDAVHIDRLASQANTINEFPFYTFLYGDLQPHMLVLPLALAALGLMVAIVRRTTNDEGRIQWRPWVVGLSSLVLLALVLGALRATNGWDYSTYLALSVATLGLVARKLRRRGATMRMALAFWGVSSLGLLMLSNVLFLPFTQHFVATAGLRLWLETGTSATELLKINGLWLFLLLSAGLLLGRRSASVSRLRAGLLIGAFVLLVVAVVLKASALFILVPMAVAVAWLGIRRWPATEVASPKGYPEPVANRPPAWTGWILPSTQVDDRRNAPVARFQSPAQKDVLCPPLSIASQLLILWVLAALLALLTSEILVAPDDVGRQQTVLNLGLQSWVLFASASAPAMIWLWRVSAARRPSAPDWAWRGAALLLIAAALVYPISATPARVADRFDARTGPTLDGMAFMHTGLWVENGRQFPLAEDAEAIEWMRANISGTPIVLEAQTDPYRWAGRVSTYTGFPTLLGWPWHEYQQRSIALASRVIDSRQRLIKRLYTVASPAEIMRDLQLYGIEYVYVGQLERALYPPAGLARFDALAQAGKMHVVYRRGATVIYQVAPAGHLPAVLTTTLPVHAPSLPAR